MFTCPKCDGELVEYNDFDEEQYRWDGYSIDSVRDFVCVKCKHILSSSEALHEPVEPGPEDRAADERDAFPKF